MGLADPEQLSPSGARETVKRALNGLAAHRALVLALTCVLAAAFAGLDWFTPPEIGFQIFYGIPIALLTWISGITAGFGLSFLSVAASVLLFVHSGGEYSSARELGWDLFTRIFAFALFVILVRLFRRTYDAERRSRLASEEAARRKTELMAMISHELGNATLIINASLAELANEGATSPKAYQDCLRAIERVAASLSEASHNFLNSAAMESGRLVIRQQPVDVAPILRDLRTRFKWLLDDKGVTLRIDEATPGMVVQADSGALRLILVNLIGNAAKYTSASGSITVRCWIVAPDRARIEVQDTGIGIAPEDLEKIRAGFYRGDSGRAMAKGYGLGLSIVEGLLKAHGARLMISSEVGRGSCFSFELPCAVITAVGQTSIRR